MAEMKQSGSAYYFQSSKGYLQRKDGGGWEWAKTGALFASKAEAQAALDSLQKGTEEMSDSYVTLSRKGIDISIAGISGHILNDGETKRFKIVPGKPVEQFGVLYGLWNEGWHRSKDAILSFKTIECAEKYRQANGLDRWWEVQPLTKTLPSIEVKKTPLSHPKPDKFYIVSHVGKQVLYWNKNRYWKFSCDECYFDSEKEAMEHYNG